MMLLREMQSKRIRVTEVQYTQLIVAAKRLGQLENADQLYDEAFHVKMYCFKFEELF